LATRIPEIFGKKFRDEDVGANQAEVNCNDETIAALMEFLYTNEISTPPTMELFQLANEWKMKRLVVICGNQLADNLSVRNVVKSHQMAVNWHLNQLRKAAEKFVDAHKSDAVAIVKAASYYSGVAIGDFDLEYDSQLDSDSE